MMRTLPVQLGDAVAAFEKDILVSGPQSGGARAFSLASIGACFPVTAVVYTDGAAFEAFLNDEVISMEKAGRRLAGLVQCSPPDTIRRKCDMLLRDLASGELHSISEKRGLEAKGCLLDTDRLVRACEIARTGLSKDCDLVVLSKFGKVETEGGGVISLIAAAIDLGVPVLIGVPAINLDAFRQFAGEFAQEVDFSKLSDTSARISDLLVAAS